MHEFLINLDVKTWVSILISFISLIWTIISNIHSNKRLDETEKRNEEKYIWKRNFEIYKEENREKFSLIQNQLYEKSNRVSIIPYFNIILKDNRIKKEGKDWILEIGFINVGKESAINIQLSPKFSDKGLQGYFDSETQKNYSIYEYLNQYYAIARDEVTFKIKTNLENWEKIEDFLKFKIKYSDLAGNEYEQEFGLGVYMSEHLECPVYNLNNISYEPILLKK